MKFEISSMDVEEMDFREREIDQIVAVLHAAGKTDATRESSFLAWQEHSETSAATWLIVPEGPEGVEEIVSAHDRLIERHAPIQASYAPAEVAPATAPYVAPASATDTLNASAVRNLVKIGFAPSEDAIRTPATISRMEHMVGRLDNVALMANAIDAADGIPAEDRAPSRTGGKRQLESLMDGRIKGTKDMARCYVALRRAQREGDDAKVRVGLVLLVAADNGEIGHSDVLVALNDDGRPKQLALQDKRPAISTGAKGPAKTSPALLSAYGAGRGTAER